jgi:putative transposase
VHHKKQTFREEYLSFLDKFEVPFDERYIFEDLI